MLYHSATNSEFEWANRIGPADETKFVLARAKKLGLKMPSGFFDPIVSNSANSEKLDQEPQNTMTESK